jgi:GMP synthase-like glutamine amidotransferase
MRFYVYIGFAQPDEWQHWAGTYARHAQRFEEASGGVPCLVVPFYQVTAEWMQHLAPQAVVMSGFARSFEQYEVASFLGVGEWVQATRTPTLALCGSHQLLGFLFNQDIRRVERLYDEPMRPLHPGEPIINPDYHPDYFMERGFYPLEIADTGLKDPLFEGFAPTALVWESHYCEIKTLPPAFQLLASTRECRIQAMRHINRPLYGLQFHPEDYNERFSDGRKLLENFFKLALDGP